jgi:hypothetical protein
MSFFASFPDRRASGLGLLVGIALFLAVPPFAARAADSAVVFTEVNYAAAGAGDTQWIEIHCVSGIDVDLTGFSISGDVSYRFPAGTIIPGHGYLVVARTPGAPNLAGAASLGPWSGQLKTAGILELLNQDGRVMDTLEYEDGGDWPVAAGGSGATLSKRNADSGDEKAANWSWSPGAGGTPGTENFRSASAPSRTTVIADWTSPWKYRDTASVPPSGWMTAGFDDSGWASGNAVFTAGNPPFSANGLVAYWPVTETAGATIHNEVAGSQAGALSGGVTFRTSGTRAGPVLHFAGNGGYVDAGASTLPFLAAESDVTWSFWSNNLDSGNFGVIVGNRRAADGSDTTPLEFVKFTPTEFEYNRAGNAEGLAYATIPIGQWVHHAVVKHGATLTYYRNGVASGTRAIGGGFLTQQPLYFGGDRSNESWTGELDDIAIWNKALSESQIASLASNEKTPLTLNDFTSVTNLQLGSTAFYFRRAFTFAGDPSNTTLALQLLVNDGAVVYLNGQRIFARNMPDGVVSHSTLAPDAVGSPALSSVIVVPASALVRGGNVLAVEVHQHLASADPDMAFAARLIATEELPLPPDAAPSLVFNEISAGGAGFQLEVRNVGTMAANLGGSQIRSSSGATYTLPDQSLAPGDYLMLDAATLGFTPVKDDKLFIVSATGQRLDGRAVSNKLRGRSADGSWIFPSAPSFGSANVFNLQTAVVINEIMYKPRPVSQSPFVESAEQWIELFNRSDSAVDLSGWKISEGVKFTFPANTMIAPHGYLVVSNNASALAAKWPGVASKIIGNFTGSLSGKGERVAIVDAAGNPANGVTYSDGGRWPSDPDGGGSSLELRDAHADNSAPEAWSASSESARGSWQTFTWQGTASVASGDPTQWNEFILGLLDAGTFLIDDISITQGGTNLIQNGGFENGDTTAWRLLGTHRRGTVVNDPSGPGKVLRIEATGPTEHMHNHAETTLKSGGSYHVLNTSAPYVLSFRARWLSGSNQLNARLYFNRLARTWSLPVADGGGTPGLPNSAAAANIGPTYSDLKHTPAVPAAGQTATVSVAAGDPDGIDSLLLKYSVNEGSWVAVPMSPQAGRYAATIPGQASGAKVQFYVVATDALGTTANFPAAGAAARAMIPWEDGQARLTQNGVSPTNIRIVMPTSDAGILHDPTNVMSNDTMPATVIVNESEIYYGCGVKLKGSERGRNQESRLGFTIRFPSEHKLYGVHKTVSMDRARIGENLANIEILIKRSILHAGGIPGSEDDLCRVIAPQTRHTSMTILSKARFDNDYLDGQYEDGADGMAFKMEYIYYPTTTTGGVEGLKIPEPDDVRGAPVASLGSDKELYRWHWLVENNEEVDDYIGLIGFLGQFGQPASWPANTQYYANLENIIDVEEWLRSFAMMVLFSVGDNYGTGDTHNAIFYERPSDGRFLYFLHDMDYFVFNSAPNSGVAPGADLQKIISKPANRRIYYSALYDICQTTFNSTYLLPWAQHYGKFTGTDMAAYMDYIDQRRASVLATISGEIPATPFAITTPTGGTVSGTTATITGSGWIDIREFRLSGSPTPLPVTWTGTNAWQTTVPIQAGANTFTINVYDSQGVLIGSKTITLNGANSVVPAVAGKLVISELMYHPSAPTSAEIAAGYADAEEFEFVELQNISASTLDLTGVKFTAGISFSFTANTQIAAGARLVLPRNSAAFALRYGSGIPLATGEYGPGSKLDNAGELLVLANAQGGDILRFTYGDSSPWPEEADGDGYSLVLRRPGTNPDASLAGSWRLSGLLQGNAGLSDATTFSGNPAGDDDSNGVPNFLQYASSGSTPYFPPTLSVSGGQIVFQYRKNLRAEDATLVAQTSPDLVTWTALPAGFTVTEAPVNNGTVVVTCSGPAGPDGARFFRLFANP